MSKLSINRKKSKIIRWIVFGILLVLISFIQFVLAENNTFLINYIYFFFLPLQRIKTSIFNHISFSVGDILYGIILLLLLYFIIKIIYQSINKRRIVLKLGVQLYKTGIFILVVYLSFVLLWSINYQRPKIASYWDATNGYQSDDSITIALQNYIIFKVDSLSKFDLSRSKNHLELNRQIYKEYQRHYGENIPYLYTAKSIFGNNLQSLGIHGYYNPLTSEAQYNKNIPAFLHPFVIAHEMAHQMGVAAEGDANLVAYYICVSSKDKWLQYSAYMNLYLYNSRKLNATDTSLYQELEKKLSPIAQNDIAKLKAYHQEHSNWISSISIPIYNLFLQLNGQKGVIEYKSIADYVFVWEYLNNRKLPITILPFEEIKE